VFEAVRESVSSAHGGAFGGWDDAGRAINNYRYGLPQQLVTQMEHLAIAWEEVTRALEERVEPLLKKYEKVLSAHEQTFDHWEEERQRRGIKALYEMTPEEVEALPEPLKTRALRKWEGKSEK
jgi:hypothetical protein